MKEEQMFSHNQNRIVQAVDARENKPDRRSQATATRDWDTDWCKWKKNGVILAVCTTMSGGPEEQGGAGGPGGLAGLGHHIRALLVTVQS